MIGRTIGKYRIVGQLGRGGAGVVYKAVDETLHRDVAVKTLNPDLANTEVMSRFRAEATILARLNHPQIATIFELFRADGDLLMVMEFVRGESLDKLSERLGALSPERAAYVIDLILSALEHAHRAGVVHRDVKPANVMVTDEGSIKIMDFGIARVLGAEQKTVDFRLMGTPAYMSPEQVLGEEVDGRSDLYSVGVLFYRLLTGALPFAADTALGMLQRQLRDAPIPLCAHRSGLPDWCEAIVQRALAKTQADRFQSAEEFREELSRATGPLPAADLARTFAASNREGMVLAQPVMDTIDLAQPRPASAVAAVVAERPTVAPRARYRWAQAAAVVLAIGAFAAAYVMLRGDETQDAIAPTPSSVVEPVVTETATTTSIPATAPPPVEDVVVETPHEEARAVKAVPPPATEPAPAVAAAPVAARRVASRAPVVATPAPPPEPVAVVEPPAPAPVEAPAPVPVERRAARPAIEDPILVFETRALVGTRKSKEQGAQLLMGDGKITIIPTNNPASPLCSFPYGRVIAINVSRGRDPLWDSPQGPSPVARAGGTLSKFGIQVSRDWVALRTSTEEQFVSMRFDEVLLKRVLLALEERTGHQPRFIELPREKD
ncbi:MAG TPA: serine/threonine-protein kinase [Vicinamibacterales bacterium]|nr:serine/threonine-protein kinase [Vicinamibacterales bacterium]